MIPARFDYERRRSVDHAIELLAADGDAKLLAGGHSLIPALKLRIARPSKLVDIGRLVRSRVRARRRRARRDRRAHSPRGGRRRRRCSPEHCPIVSTTAGQIGDPQVRHRGTLGGTLAHGDPASDMPAVMLALGAELVVARQGRRAGRSRRRSSSPACSRRRSHPDEVLVEVRVPKLAASTGWSYMKCEPPRAGLGDGRRRGARPPRQRLGRRRLDRPRQHGRHPAARQSGGGCARRRRDGGRRGRARHRGSRAAERPRRARPNTGRTSPR